MAMIEKEMNHLFPPEPDHEHEWTALENMLGCAVDGRNADYVSTPITTGPRFMQWYRAEGYELDQKGDAYRQSHQEKVIDQNSLHARQFVERLRSEGKIVIEPTSLQIGHWTQSDYRYLWGKVIQRYARRVWLLDGWQYSSGCVFEFYVAVRDGIETVSERGCYVTRRKGTEMIDAAIADMQSAGQSVDFLQAALAAFREIRQIEVEVLAKDAALDRLADSHNVAQFVSFEPGDHPTQRYCRIAGVPRTYQFSNVDEAIVELMRNSSDGTVNVRSFRPKDPGSYPFEYGLKSARDAGNIVRTLARDGLYTIVNETIDIHDGGVSGVLADNIVEFAPDDTPRCVEKSGTALLPVKIGETIFRLVYDIRPQWDQEPTRRVEFSIHPERRGVRRDHTIIWEIGSIGENWIAPHGSGTLQIGGWPNRFSRILGDKTYGLLLAHALGFAVPQTTVFNSRIAPFSFGKQTGTRGSWLRTAPAVNEPGRYPTRYYSGHGLAISTEPSLDDLETYLKECVPLLNGIAFSVLLQSGFSPANDRDEGQVTALSTANLPSVLAQQSVNSRWSGSLITERSGAVVEGVRGFADRFMMSEQTKQELPENVKKAVLHVQMPLEQMLGPISMEWAYDGEMVWVLQLHQELSVGIENVIVPGDARQWQRFDISLGLEELRKMVENAEAKGYGIEFTESVASTSHAAAIVRKRGVPTRVISSS